MAYDFQVHFHWKMRYESRYAWLYPRETAAMHSRSFENAKSDGIIKHISACTHFTLNINNQS